MNKDEIRKEMKRARAGIVGEERAVRSLAAQKLLCATKEYIRAESVMLYFPLGSEIDTSYISERAFADGKRVIYPVTDEASGRMAAVEVTNNSEFVRGGFGIREPRGEEYTGKIDLIIVPGVAFDRRGGRLGFGKGCYDAFLDDTDAFKIGLCYGIQLSDKLPTEEHDVQMDMIVTEREIIEIKKNA